jgi:ribosomal protein S18 acetylase RimI-like enzyme
MTDSLNRCRLSDVLPGTWKLTSRIDVTAQGERRIEPSLGEDPVALLIYDRANHFAAQFMRRDRSNNIADGPTVAKNNSRALGGYDAYFGTYTIDDLSGTVTQKLLGSLSPENVGMELTRAMEVIGDQLVIKLETTASDGTALYRTLTWERVGQESECSPTHRSSRHATAFSLHDQVMSPSIQEARASDWPRMWAILEPVFRAGETYSFARDITEQQAHHAWMEVPAKTFACVSSSGEVVGTYYLKANQPGQGSHVCNCGYVVSANARGLGIAAAMCQHSQQEARKLGFRSMQFNLVVSTNEDAVRLWERHGFSIVGTLPRAFNHPSKGFVDAFVMFKHLLPA